MNLYELRNVQKMRIGRKFRDSSPGLVWNLRHPDSSHSKHRFLKTGILKKENKSEARHIHMLK